ncbi:hypothetical protein BU16DRAFT_535668 [Lophium mytilinum]|uniref:MARVEL domain-containing protein n=1 Tax=Lophium mytilinum TaxID=390894 RepID=A0A6A6R725_9PEZI|nr:hypothetical protein BU16DRAFT_535668 [Lophium mytilinum]
MHAGSRNQPTSYLKLAFYGIRFCQLLASVIVAAEMFYFVWQIEHGGHRVPWMFFFLSAVFNGAINLVASALWIAGFGLLADAMNETILDACTHALWGNSTGINICRLYKLLFAASLFGVLSTISAFTLDVVVYMRVRPGAKHSKAQPLLENAGDTLYQAGYDGPYDPHNVKTKSPMDRTSASASRLPVFDTYTHGRKRSQHGV